MHLNYGRTPFGREWFLSSSSLSYMYCWHVLWIHFAPPHPYTQKPVDNQETGWKNIFWTPTFQLVTTSIHAAICLVHWHLFLFSSHTAWLYNSLPDLCWSYISHKSLISGGKFALLCFSLSCRSFWYCICNGENKRTLGRPKVINEIIKERRIN